MTDARPQGLRLPPTSMGTTYLEEYVVSLFPDDAAAQAAGAALEADGFTGEEIIVGSGEQLLANEQTLRDQRGVGGRILGLFPSEEADIVKRYEDFARQGHAVVAVHAPDADEGRHGRAVATLRAHGSHDMHYYGKRVIVDL